MVQSRKPHVISVQRDIKALKIKKVIEYSRVFTPHDHILEIGTGSGGIAAFFADQSSSFHVQAVDVVDSRTHEGKYKFQLVPSTSLPFEDKIFDVVITNHVIEHVGEYSQQLHHLQEIRRVLKPDGIAYLAVPNRWMLIEPHYRLIFLSWLPKRYRSIYLKKMRGVVFYDCEPLEMGKLEQLINEAGLAYKNSTVEALRVFLQDEPNQHKLLYFISLFTPDFLFKLLLGLMPTLIYTLKKV